MTKNTDRTHEAVTPLEVLVLQAVQNSEYHDGRVPVDNPVWSAAVVAEVLS